MWIAAVAVCVVIISVGAAIGTRMLKKNAGWPCCERASSTVVVIGTQVDEGSNSRVIDVATQENAAVRQAYPVRVATPKPCCGMSARDIAALPIRIHGSATLEVAYNATGCVVCMTDFSEGAALRQLPCGHLYHYRCIDPWLTKAAVCPLCKRSAWPAWMQQEKVVGMERESNPAAQQGEILVAAAAAAVTVAAAPAVIVGGNTPHPLSLPSAEPQQELEP